MSDHDLHGISARRQIFEQAVAKGRLAVAGELNAARQRKGLTYRALEAVSGVRVATLQGWLTGKYVPQVGMRGEFARLADVLDIADPPHSTGGVSADDWWIALRDTVRRGTGIGRDDPPYPGMRPFDLTTARNFHGRGAQIESLRDRIKQRLDGDARPLLLVTGRSGIGKSSLIAAAARAFTADFAVHIVTPSPDAVQSLAALLDAAESDQHDSGKRPGVVILDQAETLWTAPDSTTSQRILDLVTAVQHERTGVALVLVLRADAIAPAADLPMLRDALEHSHVVVGPITREDVHEIVHAPAALQGIVLDEELVNVILKDAGVEASASDRAASEALAGALPVLSQTMRTIWERRAEDDRITIADYHRAGGLAASIEFAAESAYARLSAEAQEACWPVLREMIRLDAPVPGRRTILVDQIDDPASLEVIACLRDAHLLMSDGIGITLGHDLLMTTWPRLSAWLEATRDWDAARRMLARYAALWDDAGRPDDLLAPSSALGFLEHAEQEPGKHPASDRYGEIALSRVERAFLDATAEAQAARVREAETENVRLKRSARRFRSAAIAASMLAICSLILGGVVSTTALRLDEARATALGGEIASRAQVVDATMPGQAAQLAVAAYGIHDDSSTRSTLLSFTAAPQPIRLLRPAGPGTLAAGDGLLVEGGSESLIRLIDPATGLVRHQIETPATHTYALDLAEADGRILLAASGEDVSGDPAQSCVWDVTASPEIAGCLTIPSKSDAIALLPDGSGALFGGADGTIQRLALDGADARVLTAIPGPRTSPDADPAAVIGLAAVGGVVLALGQDGALARLTDPLGEARWSPVLTLPRAQSLELSDDGSRFAVSTSQNFTVELGRIDPDAGSAPIWEASASGFESWVNDAVFYPDGTIAAVSSDQTLRFFSASGILTRTRVLPSLPTSVTLAGTTLATYTTDGTTTLWPDGSFPHQTTAGRVFELATDQGGDLVAWVGSGDGLLRVERVDADGVRTALTVPETDIMTRYGVAVSPDGRFVASAGYGRLQIWRAEAETLSAPTVIDTLPDALITEVKFSESGNRLAVGDQGSDTVMIYDVEERSSGGGAGVVLTPRTEIPVLSGGTMRFIDDDLFAVHDGSWRLQIWDLDGDKHVATVDLDGQYPTYITTRPGHPGQLGFATESRQVGILDLSDPENPQVISRVTELTDTPRTIAFSSDGSRMAIAAVSHVDVRDIDESGTRISGSQLRLTGPLRTEIAAVAFLLDDDSRIVASTYSGLLWWWDADPARAVAKICANVGEALTLDEAQALAPSLPDDARLCSR
ncbi:AAA family ATPase [Microbacterium sp.]|uniref:nSTAND1 domain-containing NTPase n=1 Tax=Microbacterium sp. TaxID=51671 RepID=UPI0039E3C2BA